MDLASISAQHLDGQIQYFCINWKGLLDAVKVYRADVVDLSELNSSLCKQTLDIVGKGQKYTEGELENNILENCACSLYEQQRMHCQVYTHSSQKSCQEHCKQLTTGYHSYLLN